MGKESDRIGDGAVLAPTDRAHPETFQSPAGDTWQITLPATPRVHAERIRGIARAQEGLAHLLTHLEV
jgi:hypothetical protein